MVSGALLATSLGLAIIGQGEVVTPAPVSHTLELGVASGAFVSSQAMGTPNRTGLDFALRLSYLPFRYFGAEVEASHVAFGRDAGGDVGAFGVRGQLIAQLPARLSPFLVAGGGFIGISNTKITMGRGIARGVHWGIGGKLFGTQDIVVRIDLRHGLTSMPEGLVHHFEALAGLSFTLFCAPEVVKPETDYASL